MITLSEQLRTLFRLHTGEFWAGDTRLTLITGSLILMVLIITPLREPGLPGRFLG